MRYLLVGMVLGGIALLLYLTLRPVGSPALKEVAPESMVIGVAVHSPRLNDPAYAMQVQQEFNSIVPEVTLKHQWIHPCPPTWLLAQNSSVAAWVEQYSGSDEDPGHRRNCREQPEEWNREPMDATVRWANEHDLGLYMHPLLWHSQNAGWLTHPTITLTADELEQLMHEHIEGVIAHYCAFDEGSIYAYNVVNEAVASDGSLYQGGPWPAIGDDYVLRAFRAARIALAHHCPGREIKLFYNDHGIEFGPLEFDEQGQPVSWAAGVYTLLESLEATDQPLVDGLGMQAHLHFYQFGQPPDEAYRYSPSWEPQQMTEVMDTFSRDFDIEIHVSELDVSLRRWRGDCAPDAPRPAFSGGDCPITEPAPRALFEQQAEWYRNVTRACLQAERCTGLQVWGLSDEQSWLRDFYPLMFERCTAEASAEEAAPQYCPKPAYWAVHEALQEAPTE